MSVFSAATSAQGGFKGFFEQVSLAGGMQNDFSKLLERGRSKLGEDTMQSILREVRDRISTDIGTGPYDRVDTFMAQFSEDEGKLSVNYNPADGNAQRFYDSVLQNIENREFEQRTFPKAPEVVSLAPQDVKTQFKNFDTRLSASAGRRTIANRRTMRTDTLGLAGSQGIEEITLG